MGENLATITFLWRWKVDIHTWCITLYINMSLVFHFLTLHFSNLWTNCTEQHFEIGSWGRWSFKCLHKFHGRWYCVWTFCACTITAKATWATTGCVVYISHVFACTTTVWTIHIWQTALYRWRFGGARTGTAVVLFFCPPPASGGDRQWIGTPHAVFLVHLVLRTSTWAVFSELFYTTHSMLVFWRNLLPVALCESALLLAFTIQTFVNSRQLICTSHLFWNKKLKAFWDIWNISWQKTTWEESSRLLSHCHCSVCGWAGWHQSTLIYHQSTDMLKNK